jgi:hypothetical protein
MNQRSGCSSFDAPGAWPPVGWFSQKGTATAGPSTEDAGVYGQLVQILLVNSCVGRRPVYLTRSQGVPLRTQSSLATQRAAELRRAVWSSLSVAS